MSPQERFGARRGRSDETVGSPARTAPPPLAAVLAAVVSVGAGVAPAPGQRATDLPASPAAPEGTLTQWLAGARDPDYATRVDAVVALGGLSKGGEVDLAVPVLLVAVRDESWFVRLRAVQSLARIAPADERVILALSEATGDSARAVRTAAADALGMPAPERPAARRAPLMPPAAPAQIPAPPAPAETVVDGVRVPQWLIEVEHRQRQLALLDPSRPNDFADAPRPPHRRRSRTLSSRWTSPTPGSRCRCCSRPSMTAPTPTGTGPPSC